MRHSYTSIAPALAKACTAAVLLAACAGVQAQYWPARKLVSEVQAETIVGKDQNGAEIDRFQLVSVRRAIMVLDRLAAFYELPAPALFIGKGAGPNASVSGPVSAALGNTQTTSMLVINTDMLRVVGDSDDMMAAVISHELGHLKAQHLSKRADAAAANGFWGSFLGAAVEVGTAVLGIGIPGMATALGNVGAEVATARFSRDQEREADALGVRAMAAAGYDPASAVRFWQLMANQTRSTGLWAGTHPPAGEREAAMDTLARSLAATYAANKLSPRGLPQYPDPFPAARYPGFEPTAVEVAAQTSYVRGRQAYKDKSDSKNFAAALALLNQAADSTTDADERAMTLLGDVFQYGLGGQAVDAARAQTHYTRAAAKGFGPAIGSLGLMAFNGTGGKAMPKNVPEARRLFVLADSRGDAHSAAALGMMHMEGVGFAKDTFRARELAQRAADGGDLLGQALMGVLLRDGLGGMAEPTRGFALLTQAAATLPWASYQLGVAYEKGTGTTASKDKAIAAYEVARTGGVTAADDRLKFLGSTGKINERGPS